MMDELEQLLKDTEAEATSASIAADSDLMANIKLLKEFKATKATLTEQLSLNEKKLEETDKLVVMGLEAAGVTSLKIEGVGTVYGANTVFPQVLDKEKLFEYLRDEDFGALISPTIPWQTLQRWCKERMEAGAELPPPEVMKVYIQRNARIRK